MAIERLIRNFVFDERIRKDLVFSDITKIRLNTENKSNPKLQLKKDSNKEYSTDNDIYAETPLITPNALKSWIAFESIFTEGSTKGSLPAGTSLGFKIKSTSNNYYWDGSNWAIAGLSNWSTEAEINNNISTFPISSIGNKSIGLIINLKTTDKDVTPEVECLKLAGQYDYEPLEDLIYDTFIRNLNLNFRSTSVISYTSPGSSSANLNNLLENKAYNIFNIRSVYDLTADPMRLNDLFSSYILGSLRQDGFTYNPGNVSFSSSIPVNNQVEITFEYVPEILIRSGQDFFEVPSFPSLVIESVIMVDDPYIVRDTNSIGEDFIRDIPDNTAIRQRSPRQNTIRIEYGVFVDSQLDQLRLTNDLNKFWINNKILTSWALGYGFGIDIVRQLNTERTQKSDSTNTMISEGAISIIGVLFYDKPAEDHTLVDNWNLTLTNTT